jgi:phosphoribosylamine--glycine ligase
LIWPGNVAMNRLGLPLDLPADAPLPDVVQAARSSRVDLVVCGPEGPLESGLADLFLQATPPIPCFGPVAAAAALESSKAFAKEVMQAAGIPTAAFEIIRDADQAKVRSAARAFLSKRGGVVLKASGLAAGKGVFVCTTEAQIDQGLERLYETDMASAASTLVLEDLLRGRECSYFSFLGADGATGLGFAVDYKRLEDDDRGPNTGGMGCYAPVPWLPADAERQIVEKVVEPLQRELKKRDLTYTGCLYVGLMWTDKGPEVVEFNVRLGDPEAEVLAVYDDRDWLALMASKAGLAVPPAAVAAATSPITHQEQAVAVVMASAGYPYGGMAELAASLDSQLFDLRPDGDVKVFASAVRADQSGCVRTASGRVLTLAGRGASFEAARAKVYDQVDRLSRQWSGCRFRRDIARHTT